MSDKLPAQRVIEGARMVLLAKDVDDRKEMMRAQVHLLRAVRALAPAPSGWTAIRTDELTKLKQDRLTLLNGDFEECPRCSVPLLEVAPRCWSCDEPLQEDPNG